MKGFMLSALLVGAFIAGMAIQKYEQRDVEKIIVNDVAKSIITACATKNNNVLEKYYPSIFDMYGGIAFFDSYAVKNDKILKVAILENCVVKEYIGKNIEGKK